LGRAFADLGLAFGREAARFMGAGRRGLGFGFDARLGLDLGLAFGFAFAGEADTARARRSGGSV
jgi:hypothetical protein